METEYPKHESPGRPFRLWDTKTSKLIPWRCFKHKKNAHMAALVEARWAKVGATIEVINIETAKMLGQYTRRVNSVTFLGE